MEPFTETGKTQSTTGLNQLLKLETLAFVWPVTTRTNKERQGLNLYGHFTQMPDLTAGLYKEKERVGKGFG